MLTNYSRGKLLEWTVELKASFHELQRLINECPTMYFEDPDVQVYVHTDASMLFAYVRVFSLHAHNAYALGFVWL
jgi:hypothetical protein